ncbi:MAG: hypothetical protein QJT81_14620 [Candidatus Thiothrix putei]|uniref:Uncharacterized protein n=1 Tax=Candidatus Thiothrix putei TaxID=3080811 RepID=A0AA95HDK2_9GAMM|nr:MAG: hypothetical protein QJT81_14620 [Candidatus Thiothrix putei]
MTEGIKGGRGHEVDRWVPVSQTGVQTLERAIAASPEGSRNLLAAHEIYISFVHGIAMLLTLKYQAKLSIEGSGFFNISAPQNQ